MTTYVAPRVNVYQEYSTMSASASTADFIPVVIGPCYHVVDEVTDEDSAYLAEYTGSGIVDAYFPSLKSGSIVDPTSVRIRFKDTRTLYTSNFAVSDITGNGNVLTFASIVAGDIEVGDYIDLKNSSTHAVIYADLRVLAVDVIANTCTVNYACTTSVQTLEVDIFRPVTDFTLFMGSDGSYVAEDVNGNSVSFTGGIVSVDTSDSQFTMTPIYQVINSQARQNVYAKVYVGYVARMTSLNKITEISTTAELTEALGVIDVRNPLAMACDIISANMTKVPIKAFATVDDTLASWTAAKDAIAVDPNLYSIVPLTQDASVLALFKDHAVAMSTPEVSMFRVCIGSAALTLDSEIARGKVLASGNGAISNNDDSILCLLTDENASFQSDGVLVGDTVRLFDSNELPTNFTISEVTGSNRIKVDPRFPFEVNGGQNVTSAFYVPDSIGDGYIQANNTNLHDTDGTLIVGNPTSGGASDAYMLFTGVTVGADVTSVSAYLKLKAAADFGSAVSTKIYGVIGASNITAPASKAEYTALTLTTASVDWDFSSLTKGQLYTSSSIKAIIDEITAEATWERGGNILLVVKNDSSTSNAFATFYAYDTSGGINRPELDITYPPGTYTAGSSYNYEIIHQMTVGELAVAYKELSQSLATTTRSNMVNIYPTSCYLSGVSAVQPGYYLAAAVAGRCGDTPGHQSMTRTSVSGISKLGDLGLFNQDQLDTIASGGTFIFTQANENAVPIIRHQLTTNMAAIEFREFSFVRNFDYVCNILKGVMDNYIGRYNITPTNLAIMANAINGALKALSLNTQPVIGPPVISYKLVSIAQLPEERDRVETYINVLFPYVLNYMGIHVVSQ